MERRRRVRAARKRRLNPRFVTLVLALVMLIGGVVGGTVAWLTDTSEEVKNTFTPSDINITLTEDAGDETKEFKMVPGNTIVKDPKVTVAANSEACWLFVKVEESSVLDTYITYTVDSAWTELSGEDGVYYRAVDAATAKKGVTYDVLTNNQVTVNTTVTKADMDALEVSGATQPTLTFTAYAIQSANLADQDNDDDVDAADAWALINPATP